ncbi:hypothetical protein D3C81_2268510 [compost metagenome]
MKARNRDERGQFFSAVEVVPFGFAVGIGEAAFHGIDHQNTLRRGQGAVGARTHFIAVT